MSDLLLTEKDTGLKLKLLQAEREIAEVAKTNLQLVIEYIGNGYTGPEAVALMEFEKLKQTSSLDLITILLRGKAIQKIMDMNLWMRLPQKYNSVEEAIEVEGRLTPSVQSNIKDLYGIIFPFVQDKLGMSIVEFWEAIPNSNLREIVPYLKVAITGVRSKRDGVNKAIQAIEADIHTLSNGNGIEDGEKRKLLAERLIDAASNEKNRDLRIILRPEASPAISTWVLKKNKKNPNSRRLILFEITEGQLLKLQNSTMFELNYADLNKEALQAIPLLRRLSHVVLHHLGGRNGRN